MSLQNRCLGNAWRENPAAQSAFIFDYPNFVPKAEFEKLA